VTEEKKMMEEAVEKVENKNKKEEEKMTEEKIMEEKVEEKKETKPKKKKAEKKIIGIKELEKEYKMEGKKIRRLIRNHTLSDKPRGPASYQWWEDSKELKGIREFLKNKKEQEKKQIR